MILYIRMLCTAFSSWLCRADPAGLCGAARYGLRLDRSLVSTCERCDALQGSRRRPLCQGVCVRSDHGLRE